MVWFSRKAFPLWMILCTPRELYLLAAWRVHLPRLATIGQFGLIPNPAMQRYRATYRHAQRLDPAALVVVAPGAIGGFSIL